MHSSYAHEPDMRTLMAITRCVSAMQRSDVASCAALFSDTSSGVARRSTATTHCRPHPEATRAPLPYNTRAPQRDREHIVEAPHATHRSEWVENALASARGSSAAVPSHRLSHRTPHPRHGASVYGGALADVDVDVEEFTMPRWGDGAAGGRSAEVSQHHSRHTAGRPPPPELPVEGRRSDTAHRGSRLASTHTPPAFYEAFRVPLSHAALHLRSSGTGLAEPGDGPRRLNVHADLRGDAMPRDSTHGSASRYSTLSSICVSTVDASPTNGAYGVSETRREPPRPAKVDQPRQAPADTAPLLWVSMQERQAALASLARRAACSRGSVASTTTAASHSPSPFVVTATAASARRRGSVASCDTDLSFASAPAADDVASVRSSRATATSHVASVSSADRDGRCEPNGRFNTRRRDGTREDGEDASKGSHLTSTQLRAATATASSDAAVRAAVGAGHPQRHGESRGGAAERVRHSPPPPSSPSRSLRSSTADVAHARPRPRVVESDTPPAPLPHVSVLAQQTPPWPAWTPRNSPERRVASGAGDRAATESTHAASGLKECAAPAESLSPEARRPTQATGLCLRPSESKRSALPVVSAHWLSAPALADTAPRTSSPTPPTPAASSPRSAATTTRTSATRCSAGARREDIAAPAAAPTEAAPRLPEVLAPAPAPSDGAARRWYPPPPSTPPPPPLAAAAVPASEEVDVDGCMSSAGVSGEEVERSRGSTRSSQRERASAGGGGVADGGRRDATRSPEAIDTSDGPLGVVGGLDGDAAPAVDGDASVSPSGRSEGDNTDVQRRLRSAPSAEVLPPQHQRRYMRYVSPLKPRSESLHGEGGEPSTAATSTPERWTRVVQYLSPAALSPMTPPPPPLAPCSSGGDGAAAVDTPRRAWLSPVLPSFDDAERDVGGCGTASVMSREAPYAADVAGPRDGGGDLRGSDLRGSASAELRASVSQSRSVDGPDVRGSAVEEGRPRRHRGGLGGASAAGTSRTTLRSLDSAGSDFDWVADDYTVSPHLHRHSDGDAVHIASSSAEGATSPESPGSPAALMSRASSLGGAAAREPDQREPALRLRRTSSSVGHSTLLLLQSATSSSPRHPPPSEAPLPPASLMASSLAASIDSPRVESCASPEHTPLMRSTANMAAMESSATEYCVPAASTFFASHRADADAAAGQLSRGGAPLPVVGRDSAPPSLYDGVDSAAPTPRSSCASSPSGNAKPAHPPPPPPRTHAAADVDELTHALAALSSSTARRTLLDTCAHGSELRGRLHSNTLLGTRRTAPAVASANGKMLHADPAASAPLSTADVDDDESRSEDTDEGDEGAGVAPSLRTGYTPYPAPVLGGVDCDALSSVSSASTPPPPSELRRPRHRSAETVALVSSSPGRRMGGAQPAAGELSPTWLTAAAGDASLSPLSSLRQPPRVADMSPTSYEDDDDLLETYHRQRLRSLTGAADEAADEVDAATPHSLLSAVAAAAAATTTHVRPRWSSVSTQPYDAEEVQSSNGSGSSGAARDTLEDMQSSAMTDVRGAGTDSGADSRATSPSWSNSRDGSTAAATPVAASRQLNTVAEAAGAAAAALDHRHPAPTARPPRARSAMPAALTKPPIVPVQSRPRLASGSQRGGAPSLPDGGAPSEAVTSQPRWRQVTAGAACEDEEEYAEAADCFGDDEEDEDEDEDGGYCSYGYESDFIDV